MERRGCTKSRFSHCCLTVNFLGNKDITTANIDNGNNEGIQQQPRKQRRRQQQQQQQQRGDGGKKDLDPQIVGLKHLFSFFQLGF